MPKNMNTYGRRKPSGGSHVLFDHVNLDHPSRSNVRSLSVGSNTSGDSANSDDPPWRERNFSGDDDERDSIDEDMYTTKAYRVEHEFLKPKSKSKSPTKSTKLSMTRASSSGHSNADTRNNHSHQKNIPSKTKEVDLSVYLRAKNAKTLKSRHVSRKSQRNRKYMESMWPGDDVSPDQEPSSKFNKSLNSSDSTVAATSTPIKKQNSNDSSAKPSSLLSKETPNHNNVDKKHNMGKSITAKKRSNISSGFGHLMKNIGVKGHPHHHGKAVTPSTPRLVRTPSAQTTPSHSASTTQSQSSLSSPHSHSSLPSALTSPRPTDNLSSFTSPRSSSTSSPFIQKFNSNILRTPTTVTPSTPGTGAAAMSPPPPPTPSLSPTISQNSAPQQMEDDPSSLGEGVTRAIFQALFGADNTFRSSPQVNDATAAAEQQRMMSMPPPRWDDSDEEEDEEEDEHCLGPELSHCKDIDLVDEKWLTDLIKSRSNSRSSSLDLTHCDREPSSPNQSDSRGKGIRHPTPVISPEAFESALKKNLTPPHPVVSTTSSPRAGVDISSKSSGTVVSSPATFNNISDVIVPSPSSSLQLHHKFSSLENASPKTVTVTTDSILQRYITPTLITQLVLQLPHDDERLTSPRLSVLKALYKNCPSLRTTVTHALVVAAHSRLLRCEESRLNARRQGSDVNEASLATHCSNLTGFDGRPKANPFSTTAKCGVDAPKKEESPGTLVRDHDSSLVELTLFILITECSPPPQLSAPSSPAPSPSRTARKTAANQSSNGTCSTLAKSTFPSVLAQGAYEVVVSIVCNVMRCYGSRLGKSAGSVEQPGILKGVFKIVDILMTNKVDNIGGKAAVNVLLRRLVQHWPRGNHVQEVAYLKLCAHILVHCRPAVTRTPPASSQSEFDVTGEEATGICLSKVLRHSSRAKDTTGSTIQKTLRKFVDCMASAHFKVASQAIQFVMQLNILHPHFISNPTPWNRSSLALTLSSGSLCQERSVGEDEPNAVEALVEVLRNNRCHWHPQVRHLSEEALDNLLDYL